MFLALTDRVCFSPSGPEELEKERERLQSFQALQIKEEAPEEPQQSELQQEQEEEEALPLVDPVEVKEEVPDEEEEAEAMEDDDGEEEVKEEKPAVEGAEEAIPSPKEGSELSSPPTEERPPTPHIDKDVYIMGLPISEGLGFMSNIWRSPHPPAAVRRLLLS